MFQDYSIDDYKKACYIILRPDLTPEYFIRHFGMSRYEYSICQQRLKELQNLTVFDAYVDNDTVQEHLDDFYKTVSAEDQVLLCSDLYGGSVNQSMYPYLQKPNTRLVSGVNMTFMMNVLCEEELSDERLEEILEESRSYLRRVNLETNETEDESFF